MNLLITPGTFVHQLQYTPYLSADGLALCGPTNENSVIAMNTCAYLGGDGLALYWMYY